jgi:hypothetical protein
LSRLPKIMGSLLSDQNDMLSGSRLPRSIAHRNGRDTPDYNSPGIGRGGRDGARSGSGEDRFAIFNCHAVEGNRNPQGPSQRQKLTHLIAAAHAFHESHFGARCLANTGSLNP